MNRKCLTWTCVILTLVALTPMYLKLGWHRAQAQNAPEYGSGVNLGKRLLPDDSPWNQDISKAPIDPRSDAIIASIGKDRGLHPDFGTVYHDAPNGIPYVVVTGKQAKVPVRFEYAKESDPGPYPIPDDAPIEGGPNGKGDRHIVMLDRDNRMLYELFNAKRDDKGWRAGSGAIFDLTSNKLRPAGWTSADAAGLPILPGLVRYEEAVEQKAINHALRFTVAHSRHAYITPATHYASPKNDENLPPMGMRVRLRADFDMKAFPPECQVMLQALKTYGMFVADNGGDWFLSGAPNTNWNDDRLHELMKVKGSDFEVLRMENVVTK